jgi:FkbM family methyltransferase
MTRMPSALQPCIEFIRVTTRGPRLLTRHAVKLATSEFYRALQKWGRDKGDETLRLDYKLSRTSVVFDLGGYLGDWAQAIEDKFGCRAYVFEPVVRFADKIRERFAGNDHIHIHAYGLGDKDEHLDITVANESSSVFTQGEARETIQIKDICEEMRALGIDRVDLMKINIEGSEYPLLDRLVQNGEIRKIEELQIQFHLFVPNARRRYREIAQKLTVTHELTWRYPFVWENWRRRRIAGEGTR